MVGRGGVPSSVGMVVVGEVVVGVGWAHVLVGGVGGDGRTAVRFPQVEGAIGRAGQLL
jgi:hypothetical protein